MKHSKIISIILSVAGILVVALPREVASQNLPFRSYTIESGLSESVAYDLLQDSDGYLWIATGYGLNRFDGVRMQTIYERDGLNDNQINDLYEGPDGRLWVGTNSGVNVVGENSVSSPVELQDLERYTILSILHDDQGDWWFGTDGAGVWLLDESGQLTQFSTVHGLGGNRVRSVQQDEEGVLWFATDQGLTNLDAGNFNTYRTLHGLPHNSVHDILLVSSERMWLATDNGISLREGNTYTNFSEEDGLPSGTVLSLTLDRSDRLWYGTDRGAGVMEDSGSFRNYTTEDGLPADIVYSTLTDREGQLWFGTLGGGATLFAGEHFANYTMDHGLASNVITSFSRESTGAMWIASYGGGLMRFDGENFTVYTEADGLAHRNVYSLYTDSRNRLWIGTAGGVSLMENGRFQPSPDWMSGLQAVRGFLDDETTGDFWVATQDSGAYRFDGETVSHYHEENVLGSNSVMTITGDDEGRVWLATYGGVSVFANGGFTTYTVEDGLPSNGVLSIFIDSDDIPWISTYNGFARVGSEGIETFESGLEFPGGISYFMFQDSDGYHWSGTNSGLVRFDYDRYSGAASDLERDLSFRLVTREQGLIANEMNARAVYQDVVSGAVWLGSAGGMSRFYPSMLPFNRTPPKIHLEEVMIAGEMVDPDEGRLLNYDRNFVQFEATGISFEAPNQILYEYRLRGVDSDWIRSYERMVRYPSLSPGAYTFQIRAYNSSGIPSEGLAAYGFTIRNPFWLQWWFLAVIAVTLVGILFFIYNYYRIRRMMEIEKMRVQIASDLHDDVGSSLTELALQTDFLRTGNLDESAESTLRQIGEQSRRIVSTLDDIVWYIDARNDAPGDLTDRMQDHANRILEPGDVHVSFDFSGVEKSTGLSVLIKENLYLIYKEAINNIAKHSDADQVKITLSMNQNRFKLRISDNGKQQDESRKSGQGLRNIELRARRIGTEAVIKSNGGYQITVEGSLREGSFK